MRGLFLYCNNQFRVVVFSEIFNRMSRCEGIFAETFLPEFKPSQHTPSHCDKRPAFMLHFTHKNSHTELSKLVTYYATHMKTS